jgi:hypothetical protein
VTASKTAREKVREAAAANGWKLHQAEDEYVDQFKKGRRSVRIVTDTYGRLTLVTTDTQRFGGSGKLEAALKELSS